MNTVKVISHPPDTQPKCGDIYTWDKTVYMLVVVERGYTLICMNNGNRFCREKDSAKEAADYVVNEHKFIRVGPCNITLEQIV